MMGKHLYIMVDLHYMMCKHLYIMVLTLYADTTSIYDVTTNHIMGYCLYMHQVDYMVR